MEGNTAATREDLRNMVMEMKSELGNFRNGIREDWKKELTDIREEIQQKLGEVVADLKATTDRVGEAETHVADLEECNADFMEVLSRSLQT